MPHGVFKHQMSPFDQLLLAKRVLKKDQHGGVCSGLCVLWLKEMLANPLGLSSQRVSSLRGTIQTASEIQYHRDEIAVKYKDTYTVKSKENYSKEYGEFLAKWGLKLIGWAPNTGRVTINSKTQLTSLAEMLSNASAKYPLYFLLSVWIWEFMSVGMHMLAGVMRNDGLKLFDPNYGEFWSRDPKAPLNGLCDYYQEQNNMMGEVLILLVDKA